jgi:hypothetical protein
VLRAFAAGLILVITSTAWAESPAARWQIRLSSYVSEGNYGTEATTRHIYAPLSLRWLSTRGDLTLTVRFLDVESASDVVVFRGAPQPSRPAGGSPSRSPTSTTPGSSDPRRPTTPVPPTTAPTDPLHQRGFGDVALVGRWFLAEESEAGLAIDLVGRLEISTGDDARSLGLGQSAYGLGVQVSRNLGPFVGLADGSYTFVGGAEGPELRNVWEYSAGLGYYPVARVLLSVSYEEWQPVTPGVENGRDVLVSANVKANSTLQLFASGRFKLSGSAPDFVAGGGLGVRF